MSAAKRGPKSKKPAGKPDGERNAPASRTYPLDFAHPLFRVYAILTDIFILYLIIIVTKRIFGNAVWHPEAAPQDIAILLAYFIVPTALWGWTPGKRIAGLVVVDKEGYAAGLAAIPREVFGRAVSIALLGVGLLWMFFDPNRQGWHDKVAGTYVVYNPRSGVINWFRKKTGNLKRKNEAGP